MEKDYIVFFSGGIGSWKAAKIAVERHGKENVRCLFTDTLIEDNDLYRFMLEAWAEIYSMEPPHGLVEMAQELTQPYERMNLEYEKYEFRYPGMVKRKEQLEYLRQGANKYFGGKVIWLSYGIDPWDTYFKSRFLGNSLVAKCSHVLKQKMAKEWIDNNTKRENGVYYMGIDWTEEHRTAAPRKHWAPAQIEYPLCDMNIFFSKDMLLAELEETGIEIPYLYKINFPHNNCGGFCCKTGQGHFANFLREMPNLYKYHEAREQDIRNYLNKDVSILTKVKKGKKESLTLEKLRYLYETGKKEAIDMQDIGGCGCFLNYDEE